jgi:ABC-type dipeptide/oligopeptide/nickel transport system permease subunit
MIILIAVMIFILGGIIGVIVGYNHIDTDSWLFLLIRLFFSGLNITWAIYALKKIKYSKS